MALEEKPLTSLRDGLCHCRCTASKRTHTHTHTHNTHHTHTHTHTHTHHTHTHTHTPHTHTHTHAQCLLHCKSGWSGLIFLFVSMGLLLWGLTGCYCLVLCGIAVWHLHIWTFKTFCFSLFLLNKLYHVLTIIMWFRFIQIEYLVLIWDMIWRLKFSKCCFTNKK